jgi:hypothetical protein
MPTPQRTIEEWDSYYMYNCSGYVAGARGTVGLSVRRASGASACPGGTAPYALSTVYSVTSVSVYMQYCHF